MSVHQSIEAGIELASERPLLERLAHGLAPKLLPVFEDLHHEIAEFVGPSESSATAEVHATALSGYCKAQMDAIAHLGKAEKQFQQRLAHGGGDRETRSAIIEFARSMGAGPSQLQKDRKALDKYFGTDAVMERYQARIGERERALAHGLDRAGLVFAEAVSANPLLVGEPGFLELSDQLLAAARSWQGDARVRLAAHRCLGAIAGEVRQWPFGIWFDKTLSATRRVCLDLREDPWVQCAAIDTLLALSPKSAASVIDVRLAKPRSEMDPVAQDNELFVRRHVARLAAANSGLHDRFAALPMRLANDESGAVRQMVAQMIPALPGALAADVFRKLRRDPDPQVRAMLFADMPAMASVIDSLVLAEAAANLMVREDDEFVLRMALDAGSNLAAVCHASQASQTPDVQARLKAGLEALEKREVSGKIRRWADEARERIWLFSEPEALEIADEIRTAIDGQREATIRRIQPLKPYLDEDPDMVGRVMAVIAQNDFGLSLKCGRKPKIQRGEWIGRRLWRAIFEWRHGATDKRQAFLHTTGRHYFGTMLAPAARMAELAPTKVPGEPLLVDKEGAWRNYLPLVDMCLTALDSGKTLSIYTSAGLTQLTPPAGIVRRMVCFLRVSSRFAALAAQRNSEPAEYCAALRKLGFMVEFSPYDPRESGPHWAERLFAESGS